MKKYSAIENLVPLFMACEDYGAMHIVVADGNVEDEHIKWCLEQEDEEVTEDDRALADALLKVDADTREDAWLAYLKAYRDQFAEGARD